MSYTTVSVSRRVVMLKVRPKPGPRKQRRSPPDQDPIVQDKSFKKMESSEALLDFGFSITPDKDKSKTPLLDAPLRNRSKIFVIALAIVVIIGGVVLSLRWLIHRESSLPKTSQESLVTHQHTFNIRPRVSSIGHPSITPRERSGQSANAGQDPSASTPIFPGDQIEMADRKWVLPSDVSGACSIGSGVVNDLVACLNRYGAQAR